MVRLLGAHGGGLKSKRINGHKLLDHLPISNHVKIKATKGAAQVQWVLTSDIP